MKSFFQLREELAAKQTVNEKTYGFGYEKPSGDAADKGLKAAHGHKGMKINHGNQGNTPGSKMHKKPDITVHYEIGDEPHRDGASGVTLHTDKAKNHPSHKHFKTADHHADQEEE